MKKILTILIVFMFVAGVWGKGILIKLDGLTTTGINTWNMVYLSGNKICAIADANIIKKACGIYIGTSGEIVVDGKLTNTAWTTATKPTWEANDSLFLSETAGDITDTAPTTANSIAQKVGYVVSIDGSSATVYIKPSELFVINRE